MAKGSAKSSKKKSGDELDFAAAIKHGHAASAGVAVGVDRLGCLALTTGRMCLTKSCDPLLEGDATSSDMAAAGRCVCGRPRLEHPAAPPRRRRARRFRGAPAECVIFWPAAKTGPRTRRALRHAGRSLW